MDGNRSNIGGLWGWSNSGTPTLEGCLEAGTYTNIASMHPMGLQGGSGTITNCYYLNPQVGSPKNACTVSGAKQAYAFTTAPANLGELVKDYGMVKAYANGILVATVTLADGSDNTAVITDADGYVANVTLAARTLYKDGAWNTLCLPFDVTIAGSPLAGATARALESASISGSTLTLTFGDAVTTLEAGTPYIIKWTADANYVDDDAHNIVSPVFSGVTIDVDHLQEHDLRRRGQEHPAHGRREHPLLSHRRCRHRCPARLLQDWRRRRPPGPPPHRLQHRLRRRRGHGNYFDHE